MLAASYTFQGCICICTYLLTRCFGDASNYSPLLFCMILFGETYPTIHQPEFVDIFPHFNEPFTGATRGGFSHQLQEPPVAHPLDAGKWFSSGGLKIGAVSSLWRPLASCWIGEFVWICWCSCCVASEVAWFFCKGHRCRLILTRCY